MTMVADIIPLQSLPRGKDSYTYAVPSAMNVSAGQLVRIPFRKKIVEGIVWALYRAERTFPYPLRPIASVENILLTHAQRELVARIAHFYGGSRTTHLRSIVLLQRSLEALSAEQRKRRTGAPLYVSVIPTMGVAGLIAQRIAHGSPHGQHLVIVPTEQIGEYLVQAFVGLHPSATIISNVSHDRQGQLREDIRTIASKARHCPLIIIATRRGFFFPFVRLESVWIVDEHHFAHRQWDREPRVDNRVVGQWLAEHWRVPLIFTSSSPSLVMEMRSKALPQQSCTLPTTLPSNLQYWTDDPHHEGNAPWIQWLNQQRESGSVVVIARRLSESKISQCWACGTPLRCPNCRRLLSTTQNSLKNLDQWWCAWCRQSPSEKITCAQCQGVRFRTLPTTATQIIKTISRYLSDAEIVEISNTQLLNERYSHSISVYASADVNRTLDMLRWQKEALAFHAMLIWNIERWELPGYRSDELLMGRLNELADIASSHPMLSIGIPHVPSAIGEAFARSPRCDAIAQWAQNEYRLRESFQYPPARHLILLDTHEEVLHNNAIVNRLCSAASHATGLALSIASATTSMTRRKHFSMRSVVVLKVPPVSTTQWEQLLETLIRILPNGWSITPDPEHIPASISNDL